MKLATSALVVMLAGCASEPSDGAANPAVLWLAMNTGQTEMQLVGDEPHPY